MSGESLASLGYLALLLVALGGAYLASHRQSVGKSLQMALVWGMIFLGCIAVYGLWGDISRDYKRKKEYRQLYTHNEKENIIIMFTNFSEFMTSEFLLWTNLKAARVLLSDKEVSPFFLIEELIFQAEAITLKPELVKKIIDQFYVYENTFLENSSNRSELTSKFIDELRHTLN